MQASERLLDFVALMEGFSPFPYNDPAGHATIGYGHLLHLGAVTAADIEKWKWGISPAVARELLREGVQGAAHSVDDAVEVELKQEEFDALVSFTYNVGAYALEESTLLALLNAGKRDRVPEELLRWVYGGGKRLPGLVRRRVLEAAIWVEGVYA